MKQLSHRLFTLVKNWARAWLGLRRRPNDPAPQSLEEDPAEVTRVAAKLGARRLREGESMLRKLGISTATRHSGSKPKGRRQPKKGKGGGHH